MLYQKRNMMGVKPVHIAFENVQIKLNKQFADAQRSKLLFIDLLASKRKAHDVQLNTVDAKTLSTLKIGTLLCLSTGYDFQNLILATVVDTDVKQQQRGYV